MKNSLQKVFAWLTPGVKCLAGILLATFLVMTLANRFLSFNLGHWLELTWPQFSSGQFWRILSYPLLPISLTNLLMNLFAAVIIGRMVERSVSLKEFGLICLASTLGAGIIILLFSAVRISAAVGIAPVVYGLLFAWAVLSGHERVVLPPLGEIAVLKMVICFASISLLVSAFTGSWAGAAVAWAGGVSGGGYVWRRHKLLMRGDSRAVYSARISHLEL